jgi:hypothetical protein
MKTIHSMSLVMILYVAAIATEDSLSGKPADTPARIDTVYVVRETNLSTLTQELKGLSGRIEKSRRQGYGGAGGWTPLVMLCDMKPVRDLAATDPSLSAKRFEIDRVKVLAGSGGMGYGGIGNGVRIGGGGFSGTGKYTSKRWGASADSITKLNVDLSYGGFMIEKAFVNNRLNYILGGLIGGGAYSVRKSEYKSSEPSAFDENIFSEPSSKNQADAAFTALGIHGGLTYSVASWFHFGFDASTVSFIGIDGFNGLTDSFITGAAAFKLRVIWGNLG